LKRIGSHEKRHPNKKIRELEKKLNGWSRKKIS